MENMTVISVDTVVVGSGAAGYSAACRLQEMGKKSVALVTEGVNIGTSRNTGSDKQTYYKPMLGTPHAIDSMMVLGRVSSSDGSTKASAEL